MAASYWVIVPFSPAGGGASRWPPLPPDIAHVLAATPGFELDPSVLEKPTKAPLVVAKGLAADHAGQLIAELGERNVEAKRIHGFPLTLALRFFPYTNMAFAPRVAKLLYLTPAATFALAAVSKAEFRVMVTGIIGGAAWLFWLEGLSIFIWLRRPALTRRSQDGLPNL